MFAATWLTPEMGQIITITEISIKDQLSISDGSLLVQTSSGFYQARLPARWVVMKVSKSLMLSPIWLGYADS